MTILTSQGSQVDPHLIYPESDGKPMADNTKQFRWIVILKENLEILFVGRIDVFIAGDLLWYPIDGDNRTSQAPDVMVVFGRPKGDRGSYRQSQEGNIAPQVTFEILSPSNSAPEMEEKRAFYEQYGVEEYYQYDPDRFVLKGWMRQGSVLEPIAQMQDWVSPRLGIRFDPPNESHDLEIYRPDGRKFLTSIELEQRAEAERQRAEQQQRRAETERQRAEQQQRRAEAERRRAEQAEEQLQDMAQQAEQMATQLDTIAHNLLQSGMSVEQVVAITNLSAAQVQAIAASMNES